MDARSARALRGITHQEISTFMNFRVIVKMRDISSKTDSRLYNCGLRRTNKSTVVARDAGTGRRYIHRTVGVRKEERTEHSFLEHQSHSTDTDLIVAVITEGAFCQSIGPFAHSLVPTGFDASQIPS